MQKKRSPILAVYIHIPFCRTICPFCSFTVRRDRAKMHEKYIRGLMEEIDKRAKMLIDIENKDHEEKICEQNFLESIYLGGGTPSCLTIEEVSKVLKKIRENFRCSDQIEISFELNPDDLNEEYLSGLADVGVNRLSLGGQSFQASTLQKLGRCHSVSELHNAISVIANSSFDNWNLDLMFGIPEQSIVMFKNDIEEALTYDPYHISLYGLEIHEQTPFGKNLQIRNWVVEHIEQFEEMYLWATNRLESAGLFQYEVSNFSKKTYEGRQNLLVWSGNEYLGFGVGAHSYHRKTRWGNVKSVMVYLQNIRKNMWPTEFVEQLTVRQQAVEFLMLSLRQNEGINFREWEELFGLDLQKQQLDYLQELCDDGRAFWNGNKFCLTSWGMLLADRIIVNLMPEK